MELDRLEEQIVYYLMHQTEPVTVARLADLCNVSSNSIRSRLNGLNEKISQENLIIVMKRSVGCTLEKLEKTPDIDNNLSNLQFDINRAQFVSRQNRCDFIIRRLLCAHNYVSISEICDLLYYSYSEVHRDIAKANDWLVPFHLKIITKRNKGLIMEGSEFHKRVCMLFQHKRFHYLNKDSQDGEPWFETVFRTGLPAAASKDFISDIFREFPDYSISRLNYPKIRNLLLVMKARQDRTDQIRFSAEQEEFLRGSTCWQIASRITEAARPYTGYRAADTDLLCLAAVIECYRSVRKLEDLNGNLYKESIYQDAKETLEELDRENFRGLLRISEPEIRSFACALYTVKTQTCLGLPLDKETLFPLRINDAGSADIAACYYHIYLKRNGIPIYPPQLRFLTYEFRAIVRRINNVRNRHHILLYSIYGYEYGKYAAGALMKVYGNDIQQIEVLEHIPDMKPFENNSAPVILTDTSAVNLKQTGLDTNQIKVIWLPLINRPKRLPELDTWLEKQNIDLLKAITQDRIHHTSCSSANEILQHLYSHLHGELSLTQEEFIGSVEEKEKIISSVRDNRIAFVTLSRMSPEADILEVLINKKAIIWNGTKTQFFVFYNYTCRDMSNLNVINTFLRFFVRQTPEVLLSLTERKNADIVEFVMNEGMKTDESVL